MRVRPTFLVLVGLAFAAAPVPAAAFDASDLGGDWYASGTTATPLENDPTILELYLRIATDGSIVTCEEETEENPSYVINYAECYHTRDELTTTISGGSLSVDVNGVVSGALQLDPTTDLDYTAIEFSNFRMNENHDLITGVTNLTATRVMFTNLVKINSFEPINVPPLGPGVTEGTITNLPIHLCGDVAVGQLVATLEAEDADGPFSTNVYSPVRGEVAELYHSMGSTLDIGETIMQISAPPEDFEFQDVEGGWQIFAYLETTQECEVPMQPDEHLAASMFGSMIVDPDPTIQTPHLGKLLSGFLQYSNEAAPIPLVESGKIQFLRVTPDGHVYFFPDLGGDWYLQLSEGRNIAVGNAVGFYTDGDYKNQVLVMIKGPLVPIHVPYLGPGIIQALVTSVWVNAGDTVAKGQLLTSLDGDGPGGQPVPEQIYSPIAGTVQELYFGGIVTTNGTLGVITDGTLTDGDPMVTNISDTSVLSKGATVSGTGIAAATAVRQVLNSTVIILTKDAIANGVQSLTFERTEVVTSISDTSDIFVGMDVTGTGITEDTQVAAIKSSSEIYLSKASTGVGVRSLTFSSTLEIGETIMTISAEAVATDPAGFSHMRGFFDTEVANSAQSGAGYYEVNESGSQIVGGAFEFSGSGPTAVTGGNVETFVDGAVDFTDVTYQGLPADEDLSLFLTLERDVLVGTTFDHTSESHGLTVGVIIPEPTARLLALAALGALGILRRRIGARR